MRIGRKEKGNSGKGQKICSRVIAVGTAVALFCVGAQQGFAVNAALQAGQERSAFSGLLLGRPLLRDAPEGAFSGKISENPVSQGWQSGFSSPLSAAPSLDAEEKQEEKEKELTLHARAAVLMDADSGRILYGKNEEEPLPMASTTKILTCILALEYGDLEQMVEISPRAAAMPKVKLYVKPGETYRLGDLLYSLMLESHNDSAVAIAEAVGGSVPGFARMMNQKARDIGCFDSYFLTPNGLDAVDQSTGRPHAATAADMARLMAYCVMDSPQRQEFLRITRTKSYDFTNGDKSRAFHCDNHNAFLNMMPEALSGKTGFTNSAGYCYVGAIESKGRTFTVALLACGWPNNRTYKWSDMKRLSSYGMERYRYQDIFERRDFAAIPVRDGVAGEKATPWQEARVPIALEAKEESLPYLLCEDDKVQVSVRVETALNAPVAAGLKVGEVSYRINGALVKSYGVYTEGAVAVQDFHWILTYILKRYFVK